MVAEKHVFWPNIGQYWARVCLFRLSTADYCIHKTWPASASMGGMHGTCAQRFGPLVICLTPPLRGKSVLASIGQIGQYWEAAPPRRDGGSMASFDQPRRPSSAGPISGMAEPVQRHGVPATSERLSIGGSPEQLTARFIACCSSAAMLCVTFAADNI